MTSAGLLQGRAVAVSSLASLQSFVMPVLAWHSGVRCLGCSRRWGSRAQVADVWGVLVSLP